MDTALYHYVENPKSAMMSENQPDLFEKLSNLYDEKIDLYLKSDNTKENKEAFKIDLYNYTVSHSIVLLLSNLHSKDASYDKLVTKLRKKRNSEMISDSLDNYNDEGSMSLNVTLFIYLLKLRMYRTLSLALMTNIKLER